MREGPCDQSFGIHVAELARFPPRVLAAGREGFDFFLSSLIVVCCLQRGARRRSSSASSSRRRWRRPRVRPSAFAPTRRSEEEEEESFCFVDSFFLSQGRSAAARRFSGADATTARRGGRRGAAQGKLEVFVVCLLISSYILSGTGAARPAPRARQPIRGRARRARQADKLKARFIFFKKRPASNAELLIS